MCKNKAAGQSAPSSAFAGIISRPHPLPALTSYRSISTSRCPTCGKSSCSGCLPGSSMWHPGRCTSCCTSPSRQGPRQYNRCGRRGSQSECRVRQCHRSRLGTSSSTFLNPKGGGDDAQTSQPKGRGCMALRAARGTLPLPHTENLTHRAPCHSRTGRRRSTRPSPAGGRQRCKQNTGSLHFMYQGTMQAPAWLHQHELLEGAGRLADCCTADECKMISRQGVRGSPSNLCADASRALDCPAADARVAGGAVAAAGAEEEPLGVIARACLVVKTCKQGERGGGRGPGGWGRRGGAG
jgi:hypothetical protein